MKIFHVLPFNPIASGGIKVHYQLAKLEQELGHETYIVYADGQEHHISWFAHTAPEITWQAMLNIADKKRDLIVGWEDPEPLFRSAFFNKVMYVQGEVFINRSHPYRGLDVWMSSEFNRNALPQFREHTLFMVSPFIDSRVFHLPEDATYANLDPWEDRRTFIMLQERKDGQGARAKIMRTEEAHRFLDLSERPQIEVFRDCPEQEFADHLRASGVFVAHSYPEGFGLPPLEAMACGCVVVGFTGGGGSDFMFHGDNCLVAPTDGDYTTLAVMLGFVKDMHEDDVRRIRQSALRTAKFYSKSRTMEQLRLALEKYQEAE